MKRIEKIYEPFNISENPCWVFPVKIFQAGYTKIEAKIPSFVKHLSGIFISAVVQDFFNQSVGFISLNFNGQTLKPFHTVILPTVIQDDCEHPFQVEEQIENNSFMQGWYFDTSGTKAFPYTIKIYLHYKKGLPIKVLAQNEL